MGNQHFPSRAEANRYGELVMMEKAGHIKNLMSQVRYPLVVNGEVITHYVADFVYEKPDGSTVVEDVKGGIISDTFKIKRKLMKACFGVDVQIVKKG